MMGKKVFCTIGLAILSLSACVDGADLRSEFGWVQPLKGELKEGSVLKFRAGGDIFANCRSFPDDMRILDAEGRQLPFFVGIPHERQRTERVDCRQINLSRSAESPHYWRQDLEVLPVEGEPRPTHNRVRIDTSGSEFLRRVELFGSAEGENWSLFGEGFLIGMNRPAHISNRVISYPASNFPHLQIRVYPDARAGLEEFSIQKIKLERHHSVPGRKEEVALERIPPPDDEKIDGAQVFHFDTGFAQRPLERILFKVEDDSYARAVRVYGRNHADADWRSVAAGEIHSLPGSKKNAVDLDNCAYRHIRIDIFHYDDSPLRIDAITAQAMPREVIFEAVSTNSPSVYFGAEFIDPPKYDIERRLDPGRRADLPEIKLGQASENDLYRTPGFGSFGPWLAAAAIGLVSIAVIKVIVDMMKS